VGNLVYFMIPLSFLIIGVIFAVIKFRGNKKEEGFGDVFLTTGFGLVVSSFGTIQDKAIQTIAIVKNSQNVDDSIKVVKNLSEVNYPQLIMGAVLLAVGVWFKYYVKNKLYILNINGYYDKRIEKNSGDLGLGTFEFKEREIDFIKLFEKGKKEMNSQIAKDIVDIIKDKVTSFKEESREFHRGYTGIAPIPFVMLAGTYLTREKIDEYFEFNKVETQKYYKLKTGGSSPKHYSPLNLMTDLNKLDKKAEDVVLAICTTTDIPNSDLVQFKGKKIVKLSVENPADNTIQFKNQLIDYTKTVKETIEEIRVKMPHLKRIHLVCSTQSCLVLEIGKMIDDRRMVQIISYHFNAQSTPKYPWGIILNGEQKGEYVEFE
jgi:hypothetical protein